MHVSAHGKAAAARQKRSSKAFRAHLHLNSLCTFSTARARSQFGAGLALWLQELAEYEAAVHAMMDHPVYIWEIQLTYGKFSWLSDDLCTVTRCSGRKSKHS